MTRIARWWPGGPTQRLGTVQNAQANGRASSAPCHSVWQLRLPTCQHHDDKPLPGAACRICQPKSVFRRRRGAGTTAAAWNQDLRPEGTIPDRVRAAARPCRCKGTGPAQAALVGSVRPLSLWHATTRIVIRRVVCRRRAGGPEP
jgi:hypothetical protein